MKHHVCKILLLAVICLFLKSYYVNAQQSPVISFQGELTDSNGEPVNGLYNFTFKIYNDPTGATPLWTEHHSLSVEDGLYNVLLGNKTSLTDALTFDTDYWLGIEINTTGEMTPRRRIAYSPYAIKAIKSDSARNADTIDGKHAFEFYTRNQLQNSGQSAVHWENLINVPAGFADSVDNEGSGVTEHGQLIGLKDDDHLHYHTDARGDARYYRKSQLQTSGESAVHWKNLINVPAGFADSVDNEGSGVTDHGQLTGLDNDDHPQYFNNTRGDSRYVNEGQGNSISSDMIQDEAVIGTKIKRGEIWTTNNNTFTLKFINTGTGYAFEAQATAGNDPVDPNPLVKNGAAIYGYGLGNHGIFGETSSSAHYGVYGLANDPGNAGVCGQNYKGGQSGAVGVYFIGGLAGTGLKQAIVKTSKGPTAVYCQESPENWFEDFGEGQLISGNMHIELDPLFLETVTINEQHPMKVFIQLNGDCNGVYVKCGKTGFDIIELNGGTSDAHFSYRVVAKRKGFEELRLEYSKIGENDPYLYPELR